MKKRVVIIGAGPAGLSCAYSLLKKTKKYEVIILEKSNLVGGISKTIEFDGYKIDTGIHRFFTKSDEVMDLWKEILPVQNKPSYDDIKLDKNRTYLEEGSDPEKDEKSFLIRDRITRIYYNKKFFDYPVSLNMNTIKNLGFNNMMVAGFSYLKSIFVKKKETSLENFYINRFGKKLYSMFFESYTEKVWGRSPKNISADWGAQRVKGLSIIGVIKDIIERKLGIKNNKKAETSLIESFYYPKLGTGQMYEEMKKSIEKMGGKVILDADVEKIIFNGKKVEKIKYNNKTIKCDVLISSMPIKNLFEISEGMKVKKSIYKLATNLEYRSFMSTGLVLKKMNLKNNTDIKTFNGLIPDSWIYIQEPDVTMGRIQIFNNWSPYIFKKKKNIENEVLLSLEYFCDEDDKYWNMSDEEFNRFAIKEASKIGLFDESDVKTSIRIKVPKAYPAYFGTYEKFDEIKDYLNEIENLVCIGRNGQHRYNNMDHSILTGIIAAKYLNGENINKEDIWNVNTEKVYHEEKK